MSASEIEVKTKSLFRNISSCIELFIVAPTKFDFVIYSILPDFAEILIKLYIESNGGDTDSRKSFHDWIREAEAFIDNGNEDTYEELTDFFIEKRREIRNPLHHEATIHRFSITKDEVLHSIHYFIQLVELLFEDIHKDVIDAGSRDFNKDYAALLQYLKYQMKNDQYRFRQLRKFIEQGLSEELDEGDLESSRFGTNIHNTFRVERIKQALPLSEEEFCHQVLGYRVDLKDSVKEVLENESHLSLQQIQYRIEEPYKQTEIQNCLMDLNNQKPRVVIKNYDDDTYALND